MKQFKVLFPKNKAEAFATYAFQNQVRVVLSWLEGSDFFGADKIVAVCQAEDSAIASLMTSEWKQFVQS